MSHDLACPMCHDGILERTEARLDQSGDSFLPTVAWRCPRCEFARFEPAVHARWRPGAEPTAAAPAIALRADRSEPSVEHANAPAGVAA